MAEKKSVISQIQSAGEDALGKLANNDAARSALQSAMQLKDRGGKMLAGLEPIEKRLDAIEKRLSALEGHGKKPAARTTTRKSSTAAAKPASAATAPASSPGESSEPIV